MRNVRELPGEDGADGPRTLDEDAAAGELRRAEEVPGVAESAIEIGAKVLWMQLGIENAEAAKKARAAGLVVVEDACLMVEHKRKRG